MLVACTFLLAGLWGAVEAQQVRLTRSIGPSFEEDENSLFRIDGERNSATRIETHGAQKFLHPPLKGLNRLERSV